MYWDFKVGEFNQRPIGCGGIDKPFDEWKAKLPVNSKTGWFYSPALQFENCSRNEYAPGGGKKLFEIVEDLASNNEIFAAKFLEGWQQMTSNGYSDEELRDGPENGWLGHYSINQWKSIEEFGSYENYISMNAPVTFTNPIV